MFPEQKVGVGVGLDPKETIHETYNTALEKSSE